MSRSGVFPAVARRCRFRLFVTLSLIAGAQTLCLGQNAPSNPRDMKPTTQAKPRFDDYRDMLGQLGIKSVRPGPNPNDQSTFDEAKANPYKDSMPDVLKMKDGTKVTSADQWPKRRAEIAEDFEREVYGRIPANVPKVTWEVTEVKRGESGGIPTITRTLEADVNVRIANVRIGSRK